MRPLALSLLLALLAPLATSAADKPNVLVLYMDD
ncbi:MAG: hypothetical protein RLZZ322_1911, partial [Verrucomicrobiota bacterium]